MEFTTNDIIVWLESKRKEIPRDFMAIIEDEGHDQAKIRQKQMANDYQMLSTAIDKLSQLKDIKNVSKDFASGGFTSGHYISPDQITNEILGLKRFNA